MVVQPYFTADKKVLPFDKMIELERIDDWTFRSIVKAYSPTGAENGTYGGHVFAQAAWAAAQTVPEGLLIHNITGYFILGGQPDSHYTYRVTKLRDGGTYCTRSVTVSQIDAHGAMFTATCSFKREEVSPVSMQEPFDLKAQYQSVLAGKENDPMLHLDAPSTDSLYFHETYLPAHPDHFNPLPGLHLRKVDMAAYNAQRHPVERRQLNYYSLRGRLPSPTTAAAPKVQDKRQEKAQAKIQATRAANMHACAHMYASDRNGLFIVPNHLDRPRGCTRMASLSHTVVFHTGVEGLSMRDEPRVQHLGADETLWEEKDAASGASDQERSEGTEKDTRQWFVQEAWVTRAEGGRALHFSRLWDYERGVHVATTFQDGLLRFREEKL